MGNETSTLSGGDDALRAAHGQDGDDSDAHALDADSCGFRVLGIQEQSPASRVGFVSFFDFILEANGIRLDTKDSTLMELIAQSEDRPMQLTVYNVKSQTTRELELTPSREWPGKGLLGVTIRFDSYEGAEDQLLHVLNVVRDSPAHRAGLRPESDYLLGTPERVFRDPEDLHDELLDALDDTFQCYVYNIELDQVRIVSISPSESWGGEGVLGAEVAHGYLHRLPSSVRATIGASVGFVNLSKDATAATDAFLRRERPQTQQQQPGASTDAPVDSAERQQQQQQLEDDSVSQTSVLDASAAPLHAHTAEAAEAAEAAESEPATLSSAAKDVASSDSFATAATSAPPVEQEDALEDAAIAAASAAPAKPRYTARTDLRFPMSTVAVYADPTQLS